MREKTLISWTGGIICVEGTGRYVYIPSQHGGCKYQNLDLQAVCIANPVGDQDLKPRKKTCLYFFNANLIATNH